MNKKNNRKGFTIVELVIVIAVIAILATVLVPTFGNVIDKANVAAAVQEAKNVHTQYVSEIEYAEGEEPVKVVYVKTTKGYVKVDDGNVDDAIIKEENLPTDHILILEKGTEAVTKTCKGTCDAAAAEGNNPAKNCTLTGNAYVAPAQNP